MTGHHDIHAHFTGALDHGIEIFHFKPQKQTIPIWLIITIGDPAVVMLHFKAVQLEDDLAVPD